jgi:hypothetical protein
MCKINPKITIFEDFYLSGSDQNPHRTDTLNVVFDNPAYYFIETERYAISDKIGYLPIVGSISGFFRVAAMISLLAKSFLSNEHIFPRRSLIFQNLKRGVVEAIPFGGLVIALYEAILLKREEKRGLEYLTQEINKRSDPDLYPITSKYAEGSLHCLKKRKVQCISCNLHVFSCLLKMDNQPSLFNGPIIIFTIVVKKR